MAHHVHFRLSGRAVDVWATPPVGEVLTFERGGIEVTLEAELFDRGRRSNPRDEEAAATGTAKSSRMSQMLRELGVTVSEPKPIPNGTCQVVARTTREVNEDIHESLIAAAAPRDEGVPREFDGSEALLRTCEDVYAELYGQAARLVQLLRWTSGSLWPARPLGKPEFRFSLCVSKAWSQPAVTVPKRGCLRG